MEEFLGESINYWLTLQRKAREMNVTHLIRELGNLHAKVGFYESRIREMGEFKDNKN